MSTQSTTQITNTGLNLPMRLNPQAKAFVPKAVAARELLREISRLNDRPAPNKKTDSTPSLPLSPEEKDTPNKKKNEQNLQVKVSAGYTLPFPTLSQITTKFTKNLRGLPDGYRYLLLPNNVVKIVDGNQYRAHIGVRTSKTKPSLQTIDPDDRYDLEKRAEKILKEKERPDGKYWIYVVNEIGGHLTYLVMDDVTVQQLVNAIRMRQGGVEGRDLTCEGEVMEMGRTMEEYEMRKIREVRWVSEDGARTMRWTRAMRKDEFVKV